MRTITVELGEKTYNIEIAAGLLDQIGAKARVLSQAVKAAIISDSNVDPLYLSLIHISEPTRRS